MKILLKPTQNHQLGPSQEDRGDGCHQTNIFFTGHANLDVYICFKEQPAIDKSFTLLPMADFGVQFSSRRATLAVSELKAFTDHFIFQCVKWFRDSSFRCEEVFQTAVRSEVSGNPLITSDETYRAGSRQGAASEMVCSM